MNESNSENKERTPKKITGTPKKASLKRKSSANKIERTLVHFEHKLSYADGISGSQVEIYECLICNKRLNGTKQHNLTSHIQKCHRDVYIETVDENTKDSYDVKRLKLLQNCVEITTVNGRPFSYLQDSGFQKAIENKLTKLKANKCTLNLSDRNLTVVKDHLHETAVKVRDILSNELHERILSLMTDIGTRNGASFLGISVRYMHNGEIITRSLGIIELTKCHTATYLRQAIEDCLKRFNISMKQIIAITVDNGSNMVKLLNDVNTDVVNASDEECKEKSDNQIDVISGQNVTASETNDDRDHDCSSIYLDMDIEDEISKEEEEEDHRLEIAQMMKEMEELDYQKTMQEALSYFQLNQNHLLHITGIR